MAPAVACMGEINESELLFIAGFFKLRAGKHWLGAGTGLDALRHVRELLGTCALGRVIRSTPVKSWVTSQGLHHHKRHKAAWGGPCRLRDTEIDGAFSNPGRGRSGEGIREDFLGELG